MTAMHFILSTISIGFASSLIEGLIIGFLFHKYQALTPQTWRPESNRSYLYSTLLSFLFGALFTLFYFKIVANYVLEHNLWSQIKLGLICFACFSFVSGINNSIYVNYDKKFVAGLLIASCLSYVAAAIMAGFFCYK
jgi:hypothetical protein